MKSPPKKRAKGRKSTSHWIKRHTIHVTRNGCWNWWGDNATDQTDQELAWNHFLGPLGDEFTVELLPTCSKQFIRLDHMTKVYRDLEERKPGLPQSRDTVLRILNHEGDYHEIAALFKVRWQTVFNIKNGRSHRDITGLPWIEVRKPKN